MSNSWFLYSNNVVTGPFSTEEIQSKAESNALPVESFIWWKGQREWIPVALWREKLHSILTAISDQNQKPVWYIDAGDSPVGPLTQTELIDGLKSIKDLARVRLWAVGMEQWRSLFEFHDVMELLGISRREHDRAPLMGVVAVTRSNEDPKGYMLKAATISVGGLGMTGKHDLRRGDEISILIKSPDLAGQIHMRGEVVYVASSGYTGVRFSQPHAEFQSLIHDYVKRFAVEKKAA